MYLDKIGMCLLYVEHTEGCKNKGPKSWCVNSDRIRLLARSWIMLLKKEVIVYDYLPVHG